MFQQETYVALGIDDGVWGKLAVEPKLPPVGNAAESHATNAKCYEKKCFAQIERESTEGVSS